MVSKCGIIASSEPEIELAFSWICLYTIFIPLTDFSAVQIRTFVHTNLELYTSSINIKLGRCRSENTCL